MSFRNASNSVPFAASLERSILQAASSRWLCNCRRCPRALLYQDFASNQARSIAWVCTPERGMAYRSSLDIELKVSRFLLTQERECTVLSSHSLSYLHVALFHVGGDVVVSGIASRGVQGVCERVLGIPTVAVSAENQFNRSKKGDPYADRHQIIWHK